MSVSFSRLRLGEFKMQEIICVNSQVILQRARIEHLWLIVDLIDSVLRADAFLPEGRVRKILQRTNSQVWLIVLADEPVGVAIQYSGHVLQNLFLSQHAREKGIASEVLSAIQTKVVRCKTDMSSGDPTTFYERNGFREVSKDADNPSIKVMAKEEPKMFNTLKRLVFSNPKVDEIQNSQVNGVKDDAPFVDLAPGVIGERLTILKSDYDALCEKVTKYEHRKAKQRGYQAKRWAKKNKINAITGEQKSIGSEVKEI